MAVERRILVVDVGGNNVKCWTPTLDERRKTPSGPKLTAEAMAAAVLALTSDWDYDVVSLGVPGPVAANTVARGPVNLGTGWVGFDFTAAFGRPTRVVNDAVMQALGCYEGGRMLFLGLGTGLGNTLISDGHVVGMELGHLPYRDGKTFEQHAGPARAAAPGQAALAQGRERRGPAPEGRHRGRLRDPGRRQRQAGRSLPKGCRLGDNRHAFIGGLRLWDEPPPAPVLVQAA